MLLLLSAVASCDDESTFSLDLRSRQVPSDGFDCEVIEPDAATGALRWECSPLYLPDYWVSGDGEVITVPRVAWTAQVGEFTFIARDRALACGGRRYTGQWYTYMEWTAPAGDTTWTLRTASGDISMSRGTTLVISPNAGGVGFLCIEEVGRWHGTGGSVAGRSGTYRDVNDSIQTVLRLTEGDCPPPPPTYPGDSATSASSTGACDVQL